MKDGVVGSGGSGGVAIRAQAVRAEVSGATITIVVVFDPGRLPISRQGQSCRAEILGKPIVIGTRVGWRSVALTWSQMQNPWISLCAAPNVSMIDTALIQKVTFKPLKFTPIIATVLPSYALVVKSELAVEDIEEFILYARNPGKSSTVRGSGDRQHVAMEGDCRKGIKWSRAYKGRPIAHCVARPRGCMFGRNRLPASTAGSIRILPITAERRRISMSLPWKLGLI